MFNNHIPNDKFPKEEENNKNDFFAWNNKQTAFETISSIMTNKNNNTNNLNLEQDDLNPAQIFLNQTSEHDDPLENIAEEIENGNNSYLTNKEDKIILLKKAPVINQNKRFTRKKRLRNSGEDKIDISNKVDQEKEINFSLCNGQIKDDISLEYSSCRHKKRKKSLHDPSISNIDQKRFRYKIKIIRIRSKYQNSKFSFLNKDIKSREAKDM